jgi:LysM repeat protein
MRQKEPSALLIALPIIFVLVIITLILVAVLFLTDFFGWGQTLLSRPTPLARPTPALTIDPTGTPELLGMTPFRSAALGFELQYPNGWRKEVYTLEAIFSPSAGGLTPHDLQDSALWVGIPATNTLDHGEILQGVLADFLPHVEISGQKTINLAGAAWTFVDFTFAGQNLGENGRGLAAATNKNEVGYYFVAAAPATQWSTREPVFQEMLNSFRFTEEAVFRPTDATPPPTPTPTPTPVVYIVQAGDTLLGIALKYDIEAEVLAARNGIEDPRLLRTGQRLIIPFKRR